MHLALAIGGVTIDELDQRMSEKEFALWLRYAQEFFLPHRREQLQSAQVALMISASAGGKSRSLADFVVLPRGSSEGEPEANAEYGGMVLGAMTSKRVIHLGQRRKQREQASG